MNNNGFNLSMARADDFEFYYRLKSEPSSVYWSGFSGQPDKASLRGFWNKNIEIQNNERQILILFKNDDPLGYVQANFYNNSIELSMGILEEYRGKGFGSLIIGKALEHFKDTSCFFSFVREDNFASKNCFLKNGFIKRDGSKKQYYPIDDKEYLMERYEMNR